MTIFISSAEAVASPPGTFSHKYKHLVCNVADLLRRNDCGGGQSGWSDGIFDGYIYHIRFHMQIDSQCHALLLSPPLFFFPLSVCGVGSRLC